MIPIIRRYNGSDELYKALIKIGKERKAKLIKEIKPLKSKKDGPFNSNLGNATL